METKMITIPFEVEKAKQIQAGTLPGRIARGGREARVVCWDMKSIYPIVAIVKNRNGKEWPDEFTEEGRCCANTCDRKHDLQLQVPEWTQFKDGDILATESGHSFILNAGGEFKTSCYAGLFHGKLAFGGAAYADYIEGMTYATEKQRQELVGALKASADPRAKEYLKRFFGTEEKPEQKFEFLQPVLVRDNPSYQWLYGNFTHMSGELYFVSGGIGYRYCIPHNEQTKHLLGTTDNWEGQQ